MSRRSRLFLDLALLLGLLVANDPAHTGLSIHEWLSISLVVPVLIHLVVNWEWTVRVTTRFFERLLSTSRLNLVVDTALFVATAAVMVSGIAVSTVLAGVLGISHAASPLWIALHDASATATIILLLTHFALHGKWFVETLAALFEGRLGSGTPVLNGARTARSTVAVLGVTALLVATIFLTVGGTGALLGIDGTGSISVAAANTSSVVRTCPRTGCTASTCHAETGQSPYAVTESGSTGAVSGSVGSSGQTNDSSSAGTSSDVLTCPRTGCTAPSCHAATGRSRGGH